MIGVAFRQPFKVVGGRESNADKAALGEARNRARPLLRYWLRKVEKLISEDAETRRRARKKLERNEAAPLPQRPMMQPIDYLLAKELTNYPSANEGRAYPGVKRLAKKLGCVERTIDRSMERLTKAGLLITKRGGPGKTACRYLAFQGVPVFEETSPQHASKSDPNTIVKSHLDATDVSHKPTEPINPFERKPPPTPKPDQAAAPDGQPMSETAEAAGLEGELFVGKITFNEFWMAAGKRGREGPARSVWRRLIADDRRAIAVRLQRDGRLNTRGIHASTWLMDRLWEEPEQPDDLRSPAAELLERAMAGDVSPQVVTLKYGSPEWHAERERKIAAGESTKIMDSQRGGWSVYRK